MQVMHGQSMLQTVKKTFTDEGIKGYYRGMSTPLVFTGTINMILFGMQMNLVEMIKIYEKSKQVDDSNASQLSSNTKLQMKAAIISGFFISPIVTVMEGVKVRLQTNKQYKSPIDVVKRVYKESGIRNGIMRGWVGVALCRMSNYSYFGAFAFFTTKFENMVSSKKQDGKSNISSTTKAAISVLAGGMAGCCYWLSCYPIDVIKNTIQAGSTTYPNETFTECAKRIYNTHGKFQLHQKFSFNNTNTHTLTLNRHERICKRIDTMPHSKFSCKWSSIWWIHIGDGHSEQI